MILGYRINYEMENGIVVDTYTRKRKPFYKFLAGALVVFLILFGIIIENNHALMQYLLPGNHIVTERAINIFVNEIKDGESFSDAVTAFCKEIINNEIPE